MKGTHIKVLTKTHPQEEIPMRAWGVGPPMAQKPEGPTVGELVNFVLKKPAGK